MRDKDERRRVTSVVLSKPQMKTIYYRKSCDCHDWSIETAYEKCECTRATETRLHSIH